MKVALLQCPSYEPSNLKKQIQQALELIGGWDKIKKNDRVMIKLNCVGPFEKEKGITTHPEFVRALIQLVKEKTTQIIAGDNPATKDLIYTLKKNGIYEVLLEEGVRIVSGKEGIKISSPHYQIYSEFEVSREMVDVDVLINVPKLKTHSFAYITVAQKNLFGLIYGLTKAAWHVRAPNPYQFGNAIADLYDAVLYHFKNKTIIHLCDGILGLEGEGPSTGGKPIAAQAILASMDAVSLDRVALAIMKLDPAKSFITQIAASRNLGVGELDKIEVVGQAIADFSWLTFQEPKDVIGILPLRLLKIKWLRNLVLEHPQINQNDCIRCGECAKICPPKAMTIVPRFFPEVNPSLCIRCWCCSEVCPQNAISKTKRPLIGRIFFKR